MSDFFFLCWSMSEYNNSRQKLADELGAVSPAVSDPAEFGEIKLASGSGCCGFELLRILGKDKHTGGTGGRS